jgi:Domain of Unknown Function (DUF1206)
MCRVTWAIEAGRSQILARNQLRVEEVGKHAENVTKRAGPWVERLARLGYVAKGVAYAAIGFLALRKALGFGGKTTDPTGAMQSIRTEPFGVPCSPYSPSVSHATPSGS